MIRILLLIVQRGFSEEEFLVVKKTLEEKKIEVVVSSIEKGDAIGMGGLKVKIDKSLGETNPNDYEALIVIGGSGSPKLMDYPEVMDRLKKFDEKDKIIGAICLAPLALSRAGILRGVVSTVFPVDFAVAALKREGATYSQEHVIEDDNIITADGPDSAKEFVNKILKKFNL